MVKRIMTKHPEGKEGVNIEKAKYDTMREALLAELESNSGDDGIIALKDLRAAVSDALEGTFDGSVSWYFTTVKLDLEARGEIERVEGRRPQHVRRVG